MIEPGQPVQTFQRGLGLDFDGTCCKHMKFKGYHIIEGEPVAGAIGFIEEATRYFSVSIHSTRNETSDGRRAMQEWFAKWNLPEDAQRKLAYPLTKPLFVVGLDDRIVNFNGTFPTMKELLDFQPWYQKPICSFVDDSPTPSLGSRLCTNHVAEGSRFCRAHITLLLNTGRHSALGPQCLVSGCDDALADEVRPRFCINHEAHSTLPPQYMYPFYVIAFLANFARIRDEVPHMNRLA